MLRLPSIAMCTGDQQTCLVVLWYDVLRRKLRQHLACKHSTKRRGDMTLVTWFTSATVSISMYEHQTQFSKFDCIVKADVIQIGAFWYCFYVLLKLLLLQRAFDELHDHLGAWSSTEEVWASTDAFSLAVVCWFCLLECEDVSSVNTLTCMMTFGKSLVTWTSPNPWMWAGSGVD